jgi:hypothetical protein
MTLSRHVVPIFTKHNKRTVLQGTGVFVSSGPDRYLISAAHTLDPLKHGEDLFFFNSETTMRGLLGEPWKLTMPPDGRRLADQVDIGVVKLVGQPRPPFTDVERYPLPIARLLPGNVPREGRVYLLTGFPETKSRLRPAEKLVESTVCGVLTRSVPRVSYDRLGLSDETNIVLEFEERDMPSVLGEPRGLKPEGMSGSPVWQLLTDGVENDPDGLRLVGIAIEHRKQDHCVVASDIGFALSIIENW